ncbi:MAG: helix-turn-helix transcriptional regulator [Chloroflexota bacterium]
MPSILDRDRAERLVDTLSLDELVDDVAQNQPLSEIAIRRLDYILGEWTAQYLARRDADTVAALEAGIGWLVDRPWLPAQAAIRWKAWYDVLEARRLALAELNPERIKNMKHISPILTYLKEHGPTSQRELTERVPGLAVSPSRLSQILHLLEGHDLIEIVKRGRENRLQLPRESDDPSSPRSHSDAEPGVTPVPPVYYKSFFNEHSDYGIAARDRA